MNFFSYRYARWNGGRQAVAADSTDYQKHDDRYHEGHFNPNTMTCGMREEKAKGDVVDVLNAEQRNPYKKQGDEEWSKEIVRKTINELVSKNYTDADRRVVDNAVSHVLSMKPISVPFEVAVKARKRLRDFQPSETKRRIARLFSDGYIGAIDVPGLGKVHLTKYSASSIYSHGGGGLVVNVAAALIGLKGLLQHAVLFSVNDDWKGRGYDTLGLCSKMELGGQDWIVEFCINRKRSGELELYTVKCVKKERVEEGARHDAAARAAGENSSSSTTAHSIPNSPAGVNRDITEKSQAAEPPRIPVSNLLKQYLAVHGLLGQFLRD